MKEKESDLWRRFSRSPLLQVLIFVQPATAHINLYTYALDVITLLAFWLKSSVAC